MTNKTTISYVLYLGATAALGGLLFGFDIAIITGAGPFLKEDFRLDDLSLGWAVSSLLFGGAIGCVGIGIARATGNRDAATELAWFLMSESVQRDIFPKHSGQPATNSSWADPQIDLEHHGFYTALRENMEIAYIRPRYASFHALELRVGQALQGFWDDEASLKKTLKILND